MSELWAQTLPIPMPSGARMVKPAFVVTPALAAKLLLSIVCGVAGFYYLHCGRRDQDLGKLVWGAALTLGSVFTYLVF